MPSKPSQRYCSCRRLHAATVLASAASDGRENSITGIWAATQKTSKPCHPAPLLAGGVVHMPRFQHATTLRAIQCCCCCSYRKLTTTMLDVGNAARVCSACRMACRSRTSSISKSLVAVFDTLSTPSNQQLQVAWCICQVFSTPPHCAPKPSSQRSCCSYHQLLTTIRVFSDTDGKIQTRMARNRCTIQRQRARVPGM